jgi:DNA-binding response OmpR family regulator
MSAPELRLVPKILLVDDDRQLADGLAEYLQRHGYEVLQAHQGRDAMNLLARQRVALVISDIFMPEGDGIELLSLLRRYTPAPAVVAMSGGGLGQIGGMLRIASVLGATRTLAKPFHPAHLLRLVEELIGPAASGTAT